MSDPQNQESRIPLNHIKFQHILRNFYNTTMQKLCEFEALYRPEIQCKCRKGSP